MNINSFNKILIIISTASLNYEEIKNKIEEEIKIKIDKDKCIIKLTKDEKSNVDFTRDFVNNNTNSLIISVGGDGSISEITCELYKYNRDDIYFSFLPNGTGNDLSKTIYPNQSFEDILSKISNIENTKLDLIKINDKTSINSTAFGIESHILKNALYIREKLPFLRKFSYFLAIFMSLTKIKPIEYEYEFVLEDDTVRKGRNKCIMNSLCNGMYYGGGFMPAPQAKLDDGIIDFNYIDTMPIYKFVSLIGTYKSEKHMKKNISHTLKIKSGKIKSLNGDIPSNIDGNMYGFSTLEFSILPKVLNFVKFV